MAEILTNKENLLKYGYCVVRNLLSNKEVKRRVGGWTNPKPCVVVVGEWVW